MKVRTGKSLTVKTITIIISSILFISLFASLSACGKKDAEADSAGRHVFRAEVLETGNGSMTVRPVEGSAELRSSDKFSVHLKNLPASPEPQNGDIVEITYEGGILETYPASFENVISSVVVEQGKERKENSEDEKGTEVTVESCIPEKSVLWLPDDENAAKLIADMNDGKLPTECNVLYDQMGQFPDVTVTDPEEITELYSRLALMTAGEKTEMSITDCYHHISFHLQDGTWVFWNFEGEELLSRGPENIEVSDEGGLWDEVRRLQEEVMGNEE